MSEKDNGMNLESTGREATRSVRSISALANRNLLITLLLFVALASAIWYAIQVAKDKTDSLRILQAQQLELERFKGTLPNILLPLNDFTLTRNPADVDKIRKAENDFQSLYSRIQQLSSLSSKNREVLDQVFKMMGEVSNIAKDVTSGKIPPAQASNVAVVAQSLVFVAQTKLNAVAESLKKALEHDARQAQKALDRQFYIILGILLLLGIINILLSRSLVRTISSELADVVDRVSRTSMEILEAVDQQTMASDTQAKSVAQIARELEEMSNDARKIATTSNSVEKIAVATAKSANMGEQAVSESIHAMDEIRRDVSTIAEKVAFAGQKAEQILESVESVQEIADETHLLALNASIESAAAGEFGKRFAVVATEVRRLADRTREFTEEIQGVVNEVYNATRESMEATREGLAETEKGEEIARKAGEVLAKMREMSDKTSKAVQAIARATNRQNESNQEFLRAMRQISEILQDSAVQMQKTRDASLRLGEVAEYLKRLQ